LIKDRRKVAPGGARKHVATIHQREAPQVMATPRGLLLGRVKFCVRFAAQVPRPGRVCRVKHALENDSFGWNDRRHLRIIVRTTRQLGALAGYVQVGRRGLGAPGSAALALSQPARRSKPNVAAVVPRFDAR
jgi:hypothetical protein